MLIGLETCDGKKLKDKAYKWWEVLNGPDSSDEDKNNSPGNLDLKS